MSSTGLSKTARATKQVTPLPGGQISGLILAVWSRPVAGEEDVGEGEVAVVDVVGRVEAVHDEAQESVAGCPHPPSDRAWFAFELPLGDGFGEGVDEWLQRAPGESSALGRRRVFGERAPGHDVVEVGVLEGVVAVGLAESTDAIERLELGVDLSESLFEAPVTLAVQGICESSLAAELGVNGLGRGSGEFGDVAHGEVVGPLGAKHVFSGVEDRTVRGRLWFAGFRHAVTVSENMVVTLV